MNCESYIYIAAFRRVSNPLNSVNGLPWTEYNNSDKAFVGGRIGVDGSPSEADVRFTSAIWNGVPIPKPCKQTPTQFTARAFFNTTPMTLGGYYGNTMAAGVVTVKAFTHDSSYATQESDGFFVRLTTTLQSVVFPSKPNSRGAANNFGQVAVENETWTSRRTLRFPDLDDISYQDAGVMYAASTHRSFFAGDMMEAVASRRGSWGYSPLHGYTYSAPLYKFEFGRIEGGICNPSQATYMRWHQRLGGDSFHLTIGVHSRSAYATIAAGTSSPPVLYAFTPIIFDSNAPVDVDRRQQIDFIQKSPCRFRVSTESHSQAVNMPYVTQAGQYAQATGPAGVHPVSPVDGRDIDDITAVSAPRTASEMASHQQYADMWTYQQPITQSAAGESIYRGVWPAFQPQTDIALPIGSAPQRALQSAKLKVTLASATRNPPQADDGDIGVSSDCLSLVNWMKFLSTENTDGQDETKENVRTGEIPDFRPQFSDSRITSLTVGPTGISRDGGALGDFGNIDLTFEQKDKDGNACVGEWHARSTSAGSRTVSASSPRGEQKTYRMSFALDSFSYWQESPWVQMGSRERWELSKDPSRPAAERGLPPGYASRWESEKSAFFSRQIAAFNLLCDSARFVSGTVVTAMRSCEGIGYFDRYGRTGLSGGEAGVSYPLSTVEQRLRFTDRAKPAVTYGDRSTVPDGSAVKAGLEMFIANIWANTETTRSCDVWKVGSTRTTTKDEFFETGVGVTNVEGSGSFGNFNGQNLATFTPSFRVASINCFFTVWADKVASFTTKTHNRLRSVYLEDEAYTFSQTGTDVEFTDHPGEANVQISSITAAWQ
jgi:hypothetical protein